MKYKYKTTKNRDVLTVDVTLPRIESEKERYKVDTATLVADLKERFEIISPIDKITLEASTEKDVVGTVGFKIKYIEPKTKSRSRSSTKKKKEETSE